jgi:hypothetical protein
VLTKRVSLSPTSTLSSREVSITLEYAPAIVALDDKPAPHGSAAHPDNFYVSTLFCAINSFANGNGALILYILEPSGKDGRVSYSIPYEPDIQSVALCLAFDNRVQRGNNSQWSGIKLYVISWNSANRFLVEYHMCRYLANVFYGVLR